MKHLDSEPDDLQWHISEMKVACRVLDDQIKALTDLKGVLKHSRSFDWQSSPDDERYETDMINIPVISSQNPARTPHTLKKLNGVLEDRRDVRGRISGFIDVLSRIGTQKDTETLGKTIERSNSALKGAVEGQIRCAKALDKTIETSNSALKDALKEQTSYAEALNDEVTYQGRAISAFTALNVLFLPLGFFSQV